MRICNLYFEGIVAGATGPDWTGWPDLIFKNYDEKKKKLPPTPKVVI